MLGGCKAKLYTFGIIWHPYFSCLESLHARDIRIYPIQCLILVGMIRYISYSTSCLCLFAAEIFLSAWVPLM